MKTSELMKRFEAGFRGYVQNTLNPEVDVLVGNTFDIEVNPTDDWVVVYDPTPQDFLQAMDFYASGRIVKCVLAAIPEGPEEDGTPERVIVYEGVDRNGALIPRNWVANASTLNFPGYITVEEVISGTWHVSTDPGL